MRIYRIAEINGGRTIAITQDSQLAQIWRWQHNHVDYSHPLSLDVFLCALPASDSGAGVPERGEDRVQLHDQAEVPRPLGRDLEERDGVDRLIERTRTNVCRGWSKAGFECSACRRGWHSWCAWRPYGQGL